MLEKILESPLDCKRSNHSVLKEINPEYSLEGLILKLKLQYTGHLKQRANWLKKTLRLGKIEGRRKTVWGRMRWLDGITTQWTWTWTNSRRQWRTGKHACCSPRGSQRVGRDWATEHNILTRMLAFTLRFQAHITRVPMLPSKAFSTCVNLGVLLNISNCSCISGQGGQDCPLVQSEG